MTPEAPAPARRAGRIIAITAAAVAILAVAVVTTWLLARQTTPTAGAPQQPKPVRVVADLTLKRGQFIWDANPDRCAGWKGYDDLKEGTQVVITDAAGKTIALSALPMGKPDRDPSDTTTAIRCVFHFEVDAPGGQQFYGVEVSHRGRQQYTAEQLAHPLALTIG